MIIVEYRAVKITLIAQPFSNETNLREVLLACMAGSTSLRIAVAWAKRSGIGRIRDALGEFRHRGGTSMLIVGIDEGGATKQGLRLALELFDEVYIVHDVENRTFHPKMYLMESPSKAYAYVGSNNLTYGGIGFNYEAGALIELDRPADEALWSRFGSYLDALVSDHSSCIKLTDTTLETLLRQARYRIEDEDRPRRPGPPGAEDSDTALDLGPGSLFSRSARSKTRLPALPHDLATGSLPKAAGPASAPAAAAAEARRSLSAGLAAVVVRWTKRLSASDAQQPPTAVTNVTGVLRLAKARHPIDHRTFFRDVLFGTARWSLVGETLEETHIPFRVRVEDRPLGTVTFKVDHDPRRIAGQNNVPTVLHWGPTLMPVLRSRDYGGCTIAIERLADESFDLIITPGDAGDFIQP